MQQSRPARVEGSTQTPQRIFSVDKTDTGARLPQGISNTKHSKTAVNTVTFICFCLLLIDGIKMRVYLTPQEMAEYERRRNASDRARATPDTKN